jgi:RHS repeat-associated protein
VVEQYEYDPYGRATCYSKVAGVWTPAAESRFGLPFLWKGVRLDEVTGLLQMRNRYYSVETGRFLTRDPIGVWGDIDNLGCDYGYVGCDPLTSGDRFGLQGKGSTFAPRFLYNESGAVIGPNPDYLPEPPASLGPEWVTANGDGRCFPLHGPNGPYSPPAEMGEEYWIGVAWVSTVVICWATPWPGDEMAAMAGYAAWRAGQAASAVTARAAATGTALYVTCLANVQSIDKFARGLQKGYKRKSLGGGASSQERAGYAAGAAIRLAEDLLDRL